MSKDKVLEPGSPEWVARGVELLKVESEQDEAYWYLSFVRPGKGFQAGGEVMGVALEDGVTSVPGLAESLDRLLSEADMEALGWEPAEGEWPGAGGMYAEGSDG